MNYVYLTDLTVEVHGKPLARLLWQVRSSLTSGDGIHFELEGPDEAYLPPQVGLKSPWFNRKGKRTTNVLGVVAIPVNRAETPKFVYCYAGLEGYVPFLTI